MRLANATLMRETYGRVFWEIQEGLDGALAGLDPEAAAGWPSGDFRCADAPMMTQVKGGLSNVPGAFGRSLRGMTATQEAWLALAAEDAGARLSPDDAQTHLAVATMIAGSPGALPDRLAGELGEVALALARAVEAPTPPETLVEVPPEHKPVYAFVHQQVLIRARLPLREVHRCRDCRFEKVVNPDYAALIKRNRRWQKMTGLAGLTVTPQGVNMLLVAGRLLNLRQVDPDYVCLRCQGMNADVTLATICPGCGEVRKEPVLRRCSKQDCGFDFFTLLEDGLPSFWGERIASRTAVTPFGPGVPSPPAAIEAPTVLQALPPGAEPPVAITPGPAAGPVTPDAPQPQPQPPAGEPHPTGGYPPQPQPHAVGGHPSQPQDLGVGAYPSQPPAHPHPGGGYPSQPQDVGAAQPGPGWSPGWYPDPLGRYLYRYYDGNAWTPWASNGGEAFVDAIPG